MHVFCRVVITVHVVVIAEYFTLCVDIGELRWITIVTYFQPLF